MPKSESVSVVLAYQKSSLAEIQRLYETLHLDLHDYLRREERIAAEIRALEQDFARLSEVIQSGELPTERMAAFPDVSSVSNRGKTTHYPRIEIPKYEDFEQLLNHAERYLTEHEIDITRDPLLQVLDSDELASIRHTYMERYKDVIWRQEEYVVIVLAGIIATLVDMLLIKVPGADGLLMTLPQGYALTKWLQERSKQLQQQKSKQESVGARTSCPPPTSGQDARTPQAEESGQDARAPKMETDSIFSFIAYLSEQMVNAKTTDEEQKTPASSQTALIKVCKVLFRLFSTVFTSAGLDMPFGRLNRLARQDTGETDEEAVSWETLAEYMQQQGFDLNELLMFGVVPATVDVVVKGFWLFRLFDHSQEEPDMHAKIPSMLMLGHTIALSGNLVKTGLIYHFNPLSLNWERMFRFFPVLFSWIIESLQKEHLIRVNMDKEWVRLYKTIKTLDTTQVSSSYP